jgi:hypothetical protein
MNKKKAALSCAAAVLLALTMLGAGAALFVASLDDHPIDGWQEAPTTPTHSATP